MFVFYSLYLMETSSSTNLIPDSIRKIDVDNNYSGSWSIFFESIVIVVVHILLTKIIAFLFFMY